MLNFVSFLHRTHHEIHPTDKRSKKQKTNEDRDRRLNLLMKRNKDVMDAVKEVITCDKLSRLPDLVLDASRLLDDIERGSLSSNTKYNSLVGRWFTKEKKDIKLKPVEKESKQIFIERDRIITVNTRRIIIENEQRRIEDVKKQYRVLAVFTKSYNKWFMTEQKQLWSADMKPDQLSKYRCSIRMVTEGSVEDYEDVDLNTSQFDLKCVARIISGVDIVCAHNCLFNY